MPIPTDLGGSGGSILDCCLVNEALAEGGRDGGLRLSLGAHWVIGSVPISLGATATCVTSRSSARCGTPS